MVHVQAANGMWVWVPVEKLDEWSEFQEKLKAGWDPEEDPEYKAKLDEKLSRI